MTPWAFPGRSDPQPFSYSIETGNTFIEAKDLLRYTIDLLESARPVELDPSTVAQELGHLIEEDKVQNSGHQDLWQQPLLCGGRDSQSYRPIAGKGKVKLHLTLRKSTRRLRRLKRSGNSLRCDSKEAIHQAIQNRSLSSPGTWDRKDYNYPMGWSVSHAQLHQLDLRKKTRPSDPPGCPNWDGQLDAWMSWQDFRAPPSTAIWGWQGDDTSHLEDYLDADFIIVDEFSMVDTWLANQLLSNIATDRNSWLWEMPTNYLPSALVRSWLISCRSQASLRPNSNIFFRQEWGFDHCLTCRRHPPGQASSRFHRTKADCLISKPEANTSLRWSEQIHPCCPSRGQIPARDIQVLAPMYKGQAGIDNINTLMKDLLNPAVKDQVVLTRQTAQYRDGDKVIHLVNDAEAMSLTEISATSPIFSRKIYRIEARWIDHPIWWQWNRLPGCNEWYKIRLAYAMSIHKSQGSEFPVVILPITNQSHRMLQRNLIYTAITRSKEQTDPLRGNTAPLISLLKIQVQRARPTWLNALRTWTEAKQPQTILHPVATASATVESARSKEETVETKAETSKPHLSIDQLEDNLHAISPMIGLTEEEIAAFFDIKKTTSEQINRLFSSSTRGSSVWSTKLIMVTPKRRIPVFIDSISWKCDVLND